MSKMASHWSFGHLQPKLWAKEGSGVKLAVWLPITKSRESISSRHPNLECNMALKSSRRQLQLWLRPRLDQTLQLGDMSSQSFRTLTRDNFRTPTWESREKEPFGCSLRGVTQRILYGGRWWLPLSPGRCESCVSKCPWLVPTPKGVPECELTLLMVGFGCRFKLDNLVPLPSLIPGLLARPSTPL
jgi:hypothetical protein